MGLDLILRGDSSLQMTGGDILNELILEDSSHAMVSGGKVAGNVVLDGASQLTVSGDVELADDLSVRANGRMLMTGGMIGGIRNNEPLDTTLTVSGQATISGGNILANAGLELGVVGAGRVTVNGSELLLQPMANPPLVEKSEFLVLTGKLADGRPIDWDVWLFDGGTLAMVPEPGSLFAMGLGLGVIAFFGWRARTGR